MSASGGPEDFYNEVLSVVEMNSADMLAAVVLFDLDDFDAALAELDARYLVDKLPDQLYTGWPSTPSR
jgi:hypothetical protein